MDLTNNSALENLTRIVQVIGRDKELRCWFSSLERMSSVERRNEIYATSDRMRTQGKDAELIVSFRLLSDPRVFEAASQALQEYGPSVG